MLLAVCLQTTAVGADFDSLEGAESIIENVVYTLCPMGDLVSLLQDSPELVKGGLILWLQNRMRNASEHDDYVSMDRYLAFYDCLRGVSCDELKKLQNSTAIGGECALNEHDLCECKNGAEVCYFDTAHTKKRHEIHYVNNKMNGLWTQWCENGNMVQNGMYLDGLKEGEWINYDSFCQGRVQYRINFLEGKYHGLYQYYDSNQKLAEEGLYRNDKQVGIWKWFNDDGSIKNTVDYGG